VPLPGDPLADPTGTGRTRWTVRWKPALNAFAIAFLLAKTAGNTVSEIDPIGRSSTAIKATQR
jgi:hypothetical protein